MKIWWYRLRKKCIHCKRKVGVKPQAKNYAPICLPCAFKQVGEEARQIADTWKVAMDEVMRDLGEGLSSAVDIIRERVRFRMGD